MTRWPGPPSARGPGVKCSPYRWSSCPSQDGQRAGLPVPGRRIGGGGSLPKKKCSHLGGGDGGFQAINTQPAGKFGGMHQAAASRGNWAELPTYGYGGLAAHDSGLAAPLSLASVG